MKSQIKNLWSTLPTPFFVQAPMEDVTDTVFRQIIGSVGAPDLYFTEFTNAEGIIKGADTYVKQRLQYTKSETPLIAQIWGNNPHYYKEAAKLLSKLGYNGIDINMGCPVRDVIKNGCCSALINNPQLAKELYNAAVEGGEGLPVSIKTRIGFSKIQTEEWIGFLLTLKPAAIIVHARTAKEMSKVPAHWEEFGVVTRLRDKISKETKIVANGDIETKKQGVEIARKYKVDGIMIGRGMLHNPWVFADKDTEEVSFADRLMLLKKHIKLYETTWGRTKNFEIMKKFYKAYISGFENASDLRLSLMQFHNAQDTIKKIDEILEEL